MCIQIFDHSEYFISFSFIYVFPRASGIGGKFNFFLFRSRFLRGRAYARARSARGLLNYSVSFADFSAAEAGAELKRGVKIFGVFGEMYKKTRCGGEPTFSGLAAAAGTQTIYFNCASDLTIK